MDYSYVLLRYLTQCDGAYRFKSREMLCLFLDLEPPYNACHELNRNDSPRASKDKSAAVSALLNKLLTVKVPSSSAASLLKELSTTVVCGRGKCLTYRAPDLYQEWCGNLWKQCLLMTNRPNVEQYMADMPEELTKHAWESALNRIRRKRQPHDYKSYLAVAEYGRNIDSEHDESPSDGSSTSSSDDDAGSVKDESDAASVKAEDD